MNDLNRFLHFRVSSFEIWCGASGARESLSHPVHVAWYGQDGADLFVHVVWCAQVVRNILVCCVGRHRVQTCIHRGKGGITYTPRMYSCT